MCYIRCTTLVHDFAAHFIFENTIQYSTNSDFPFLFKAINRIFFIHNKLQTDKYWLTTLKILFTLQRGIGWGNNLSPIAVGIITQSEEMMIWGNPFTQFLWGNTRVT
jgi:hypothetical protein